MSHVIYQRIDSIFEAGSAKKVRILVDALMFMPGIAIVGAEVVSRDNDKDSKATESMLVLDVVVSNRDERTQINIEIYGQETDRHGKGIYPHVSSTRDKEGYGLTDHSQKTAGRVIEKLLTKKPDMEKAVSFDITAKLDTSKVELQILKGFDWKAATSVGETLACILLLNEVRPDAFTQIKMEMIGNEVVIWTFSKVADMKLQFRIAAKEFSRPIEETVRIVYESVFLHASQRNIGNLIEDITVPSSSDELQPVISAMNKYLSNKRNGGTGYIFEDPRYPKKHRSAFQDVKQSWIISEIFETRDACEANLRQRFQTYFSRMECLFMSLKEGMPDSASFTQKILIIDNGTDDNLTEFERIAEAIIADVQPMQFHGDPIFTASLIATEDKWRLDIQAGIIAAKRLQMMKKRGKFFPYDMRGPRG